MSTATESTKAIEPIGISVTTKASNALRRIASKEDKDPDNFGLRVGVKGGGCSGLVYVLLIEDNRPTETDRVISDNNINIFIDKKSYIYLAGTEYINRSRSRSQKTEVITICLSQ